MLDEVYVVGGELLEIEEVILGAVIVVVDDGAAAVLALFEDVDSFLLLVSLLLLWFKIRDFLLLCFCNDAWISSRMVSALHSFLLALANVDLP